MNDIGQHGRAAASDARALAQDLSGLAFGIEDALERRLTRHPYSTLAIAAGSGYVLGGGVPPWLLRMGLAVGGRAVLTTVVREALAVREAARVRAAEPVPSPADEPSPAHEPT